MGSIINWAISKDTYHRDHRRTQRLFIKTRGFSAISEGSVVKKVPPKGINANEFKSSNLFLYIHFIILIIL
jgi:hypothetical protein